MNSYMLDGHYGQPVAEARLTDRVAFIRKTYAHLTGAIALFVGLEAILLNMVKMDQIVGILRAQPFAWLGVMVLFIAGGFLAQYMAHSRSRPTQYLGLGLYIAIEALFFLPILAYAEWKFPNKNIALQAGIMTLLVFGGLTASVFITKKDFSFLGHGLMVMSFLTLGLVIFAVVFGVNLGMWFSFLMIAIAAAYILYDTSNVLHHYQTDMYVGAALALFASIALLFYYIVRLLLQVSSDD